ncbi:copper homeostasis protein CutC [Mucilaginibacter gracilis]|uniref:PF03932 family protein CutC n=1 Tax=Mucilaginibacter gracilis TaxID=423350 RepID=A0A495J0R8_9SPHI|nr:copper homeostasis protein CutC [Mucilaginibacter gracilis]RKR82527.1 copper homeostasis protein CutC [Mucilaginibacter gracilis]
MIKLEVCANSVHSALAAQEGGAIRVELCDNLREGGTTPSCGQIKIVRDLLNIQLYVLIRPRTGDFVYSNLEFEVMKLDIETCVKNGCDGVVIGILNRDGSIDKERCAQLISIAKAGGLGVTFHRAFDVCRDYFEALEDIIELGCERILTSGGKSTAMEGANIISRLVSIAANRITIMPGSGINEYNIADLVRYSGAIEFHSSARSVVESKMTYRNDNILLHGVGEEYTMQQTDPKRVKRLIKLANGVIG